MSDGTSSAPSRKKPIEERFLALMPSGAPDECWTWTGHGNQYGYGIVRRPDTLVHRMSYLLFVGPIPEGMTVDHTCHRAEECAGGWTCLHRRCCNPSHLALAGRGPNALRGNSPAGKNSRKTHCPQGHLYDEVNTYLTSQGKRQCRTCRRVRDSQRSRLRGRGARQASLAA